MKGNIIVIDFFMYKKQLLKCIEAFISCAFILYTY